MACYKSGGCGVYENRSCSECPASKPEYANRNQKSTSDMTSSWVQHCFEIECAKCGGEALRDDRNRYVYSNHCPHCGREMINT